MIEVYPLSMPLVDFNILIRRVNEALGRSPTRGLDSNHEPINSYRAFIVALTDLRIPGIHPRKAMDVAHEALSHLWFSFLVRGPLDVLAECWQKAGARVLIAKSEGEWKVAILTASLQDWVLAINSYISTDQLSAEQLEITGVEVRRFYDTLLVFFEQVGLGDLWTNQDKRMQSDGTFLLEKL